MSAKDKTLYRTKSGVLVMIEGAKQRFRLRNGKSALKGYAIRVDTGGRHGWLWMHQLEVVR